jgi:tetratricopeptide (TPR) repeat protein
MGAAGGAVVWVPARNYNRFALTGKVRVSRLFVLLSLLLAGCLPFACAHHNDLTKSSSQDDFGVQMARQNLWREAMFRFRRAVEINPSDAMAHNNLAVAYEANGDFEQARKEYLEALRLDRSNQYIQKNYSRFVEFLSRNKKRQSKDVKTVEAPPATTTTAAAETTPPAAIPTTTTEAPAPAPAPPATTTQPPTPTPPGVSR